MSEVLGSVPTMSNTCTRSVDDPVPSAALGAGEPHRRLLREEVATALSAPVGPELLAVLVDLAGRSLSARERCESVVAWRRLTAFCDAGRLDAIAALDREMLRPDRHPDHRAAHRRGSLRPAADEISAALAIAPAAASRAVGLARRLDRDLPLVADALADGVVDLAQARLVSAITRDVEPATRDRLQALAVRHAPRASVRQLRQLLEAEAERLQPGWAAQRATVGRAERDVALGPSPLPGCRRLTLDLPALEATAAWLCVNRVASSALAGGVDGDGRVETRTLAQLRADTATVLLTRLDGPLGGTGPVATTPPPSPCRRRSGSPPWPRCRSSSPPTRCWIAATCPPTSPASGRSTPSTPGRWPATPGGAGWSPTRCRAPCSTAAPPSTGRHHACAGTSSPVTAPAPTPPAPCPRSSPRSTTRSPSAGRAPAQRRAPRRPPTPEPACANATTTPRPTSAGAWSSPPPDASPGPRPPGSPTTAAPPPLVPGWDRPAPGHDPVEDAGGVPRATSRTGRPAEGATPPARRADVRPGTGWESS